MADIIKFTMPGQPEYITVVRLGIAALADHVGFDIEAIDDIKLAVEEASKAMTCHGFHQWINQYDVICEVEKDKMTIRVSDSGEGRGIEKLYRPCKNCPQDGDLAMFLISTLMDSVEVVTGEGNKKSIIMVKNK